MEKNETSRVIMVRHGESLGNAEGFFAGQTDIPLTPLGQRQAERTAEYLKYVDLSAFTSDEQVYDIDDVKAAFEMHLTSKYPKILIRCNKFDGE